MWGYWSTEILLLLVCAAYFSQSETVTSDGTHQDVSDAMSNLLKRDKISKENQASDTKLDNSMPRGKIVPGNMNIIKEGDRFLSTDQDAARNLENVDMQDKSFIKNDNGQSSQAAENDIVEKMVKDVHQKLVTNSDDHHQAGVTGRLYQQVVGMEEDSGNIVQHQELKTQYQAAQSGQLNQNGFDQNQQVQQGSEQQNPVSQGQQPKFSPGQQNQFGQGQMPQYGLGQQNQFVQGLQTHYTPGQQSQLGPGQQSQYGLAQQSQVGQGRQFQYGLAQQSQVGQGQQSQYGLGQQSQLNADQQSQHPLGQQVQFGQGQQPQYVLGQQNQVDETQVHGMREQNQFGLGQQSEKGPGQGQQSLPIQGQQNQTPQLLPYNQVQENQGSQTPYHKSMPNGKGDGQQYNEKHNSQSNEIVEPQDTFTPRRPFDDQMKNARPVEPTGLQQSYSSLDEEGPAMSRVDDAYEEEEEEEDQMDLEAEQRTVTEEGKDTEDISPHHGTQDEDKEQEDEEDDWYDDPNSYSDDGKTYLYGEEKAEDNAADPDSSVEVSETDEYYRAPVEYPGEGDTFEEDVVDSAMVKKDKQPTAPSSMVLFYTWMIVAVLIMVVTISTYQTRCKALRSHIPKLTHTEDRKRLLVHEYA